MLKEDADVTV